MLHRITAVFTRRKVNIESLCVSETETKGISRFTISVELSPDDVKKIVGQIARFVEVVKVEYHTNEQLVFKEIAFFKVRAESAKARTEIEEHARRYGASIIYASASSVIVEKTGREADVDSLFYLLEPFGLLEFVRSGRIAVVKDGKERGKPEEELQANYKRGADTV